MLKFRQSTHPCSYYKIQNNELGSVPPCISVFFGTIFAGRVPILRERNAHAGTVAGTAIGIGLLRESIYVLPIAGANFCIAEINVCIAGINFCIAGNNLCIAGIKLCIAGINYALRESVYVSRESLSVL